MARAKLICGFRLGIIIACEIRAMMARTYTLLLFVLLAETAAFADDPSQVLDAYQLACQSLWSYDVHVVVSTFPSGRKKSAQPLVKISRQLFSDGQYLTELLSENGIEVPRGKVVARFDGEKEISIRVGTKSTQGMITGAATGIGSVGGVGWTSLFQDVIPGIKYASLIRERDFRLVPRSDDQIELLSSPDVRPGAAFGPIGFRFVLDPSRGFMPAVIDHLIAREGEMRLWTRFENELIQAQSGLWLPIRSKRTSYNLDTNGEQSFGYELVVVDLERSRFNEPLNKTDLEVDIPAGASVDDQVNRISYVAGKEDVRQHLDELTRQGRVNMERFASNSLRPNQRPWRLWLLIGVNALLVAVVVALAYKRLSFYKRHGQKKSGRTP